MCLLNKLFTKPVMSPFDPLISRFDPCSAGKNSDFAPETHGKPNKAAHSHTSPSRLQNERPHAEQIAKNAWQPKHSKSERGAALTPPCRKAQCAASLPTRLVRFPPSRPLS